MENLSDGKQDAEYKKYILEKIDEFNQNGKKTVLFLCDTYYPIIDGVIKVLENYAEGMSAFYNVVLAVPKHKGVVAKSEKYLVLGVNSMFFGFVNYDLAFPETDNFVKKAIKKLRIDIVHAHSPFNMGKFAAKIARQKSCPLVMTMHSQYKQDFEKYVKNGPILNTMVRGIVKVFSKSDEVWTMHDKTAAILRGYGYKGRFFYIENATDYSPVSEAEAKRLISRVNKKYKLEEDLPVFLFVGRLVSQKNIFFIANALKLLKDRGLKFKMFFVGNGPDETELRARIKALDLERDVILTGRIDDRELLSAIYLRAQLFLFPSMYDSSSIVQIEAAAFKTPAVFLKGSVTAGTVTDGVNGFIAENSLEGFVQTVYDAVSDKKQLERISQNAYAQLYVTWQDVILKAKKRYEYLIEQNNNKQRKLAAVRQIMKKVE